MVRILSAFLMLLALTSNATADVSQRGDALSAMAPCKPLPASIRVLKRSSVCGNVPTVILGGSWQRIFSAAFRWEDGSSAGQDRNPNFLWDSSAASSPYKTQRRLRRGRQTVMCYGNFLNNSVPVPSQLTIKRSAAPRLNRFCVDFR